jgi:hypothetical protein
VWVLNLVADIKGETQTEGIREQGAEEINWADEGWSERKLKKIAYWRAS